MRPGSSSTHRLSCRWQTLPVAVAAQRVQISAHPDAYAKWEPSALALIKAAGGTAHVVADQCATTGGLSATIGTWNTAGKIGNTPARINAGAGFADLVCLQEIRNNGALEGPWVRGDQRQHGGADHLAPVDARARQLEASLRGYAKNKSVVSGIWQVKGNQATVRRDLHTPARGGWPRLAGSGREGHTGSETASRAKGCPSSSWGYERARQQGGGMVRRERGRASDRQGDRVRDQTDPT